MKRFWTYLLTCACLTLCTAAIATAQSLTSDKSDYAPGTPAQLTGSGFAAGDSVTLQVLHADGTPATGTDHDPWKVLVGDDGSFVTTWMVCSDDCVGSLLRATATALSGSAYVEFTDGPNTCTACGPSEKPGNVPSYGTATTDGVKNDFPNEWTASDLFTNMYTAGNATKPLLSKAYVKFVCNPTKTLATVYVFVKCEPGKTIIQDPVGSGANNWLKYCVNGQLDKLVDSADPTFNYVVVGGQTVGYEASFTLAPGGPYNVVFHAEVESGGAQTSASDGFPGNGTCLVLTCPEGCTPCELVCPPDVSIDCGVSTDPSNTGSPTGCAGATYADVITPGNCAGNYTIARTWTASNTCGGTSTCVQTITVTDTHGPSITCPPDVSIDCTASVDPSNTGSATAADDCSGVASITHSDSDAPGNCAGNHVITRTWTATDNCGNSSSCVQTITVTDTHPPVPPTAPEAASYQCVGDVPAPGTLTAKDDCSGDITATGVDTDNGGKGCKDSPLIITRTWTFDDGCGNSLSVSQTITVVDDTKPEAPVSLEPASYQCKALVPPPGQLTAHDNCKGDITATGVDTDNGGTGCKGNPLVISRSWTFIDDCGTSITLQTITVEDTEAPVLANLPTGGDLDCNPETLPSCDAGVTARDNCDGTVSVTCTPGAITDVGTCGKSQTFTYSAADACGNTISKDVTYTWKVDETAPVLANLPAGGDLGCNPTLPTCSNAVTASDNCDGTVSVTCTAGAVTGKGCDVRSQTFTYSAADACGNKASQDVTYTWTVGKITVCKFYDTNANGTQDAGEPGVAGWTFKLDGVTGGTTGSNGCYTFCDVANGSHTVSETLPANWVNTTGGTSKTVVVSSGACNQSLSFGNYCYKAPSNGLTLGFWTNKNGQNILAANPGWTSLLTALNLKDAAGNDFNPTSYAQLKTWLTNASATNMAYMLSAQLATNVLDEAYNNLSGTTSVVVPGGVKTLANVCIVPFLSVTQAITCGNPALVALTSVPGSTACGCVSNNGLVTINDLQDRANCLLGAYNNTTPTSTQRTYQECVKDILDMINNNGNPTGSSAYPCGGVSQYINPPGTCPVN